MSRVLHQPVRQLTRKIKVRGLAEHYVTIKSQLRLAGLGPSGHLIRTLEGYPTTASACRTDEIFTQVRSPMRSPSHCSRTGWGLVIVSIGTSSRRYSFRPRCSPFWLIA